MTIGIVMAFVAGFMVAQIINYSTETPLSKEYTAVLLNDRNYFPEVYSIISHANKSIHMIMYEILWYSTQNDVMKLVYLLGDKASEGLDVKIPQNSKKYLENGYGINCITNPKTKRGGDSYKEKW